MTSRWGVSSSEKTVENRLRRVAQRQGLTLTKNRRRDKRAADYGVWYLTDAEGVVALASKELGDVARHLGEPLHGPEGRPA